MPDRHDDDLIDELRGLATWLETPEPADQRAAVRDRLMWSARRRNRIRVTVAAAVAALAGTVAAVAPARAAVIDAVGGLLRVAGIEVRWSAAPADLPPVPSPLPSVSTVTLEQARRIAGFPLRVPAALGEPEEVVLADPDPAGVPRVITLVYRGGTVRFDQIDGRVDPVFFKAAPAAEWLTVGTNPAIWMPGPHTITYVDRAGTERTSTARLAAPTLIWTQDTRTYRLEGLPTSAEALVVAESLK